MSHKNIAFRTKAFDIPEGIELIDVAVYVKNTLVQTGEKVEMFTSEDGSILLNIESKDNLAQKLCCVSSGIKAQLSIDGDHRLVLKFSGGKWLNKVIGGGVALVWWPMAFTTGVGAVAQIVLPISIVECIERYIKSQTESIEETTA